MFTNNPNMNEIPNDFPEKPPFLVVQDHPDLVRDEMTNAIINMNIDEYHNYKELKKIKDEEYGRVDKIETEMQSIKGDLDEIKSMLMKVLSNGN